jgi:SAM-dependent methyltransferase
MLTDYERNQEFNSINKFLHAFRYKQLLLLVSAINRSKTKLKILDIGSGTSKSYGVLKEAGFDIEYHGVEILKPLYEQAERIYGNDHGFNLHIESIESWIGKFDGFDLILAQESFEHMPPLLVSRVIDSIAKSSFGTLFVTVPVEIGPAILIKNLGSYIMGYARHKEYRWSETVSASLYKFDNFDRHKGGHKGFDWRWIAQTLRLNVKIKKTIKSPFQLVPSFLAPSVGFICSKYPD